MLKEKKYVAVILSGRIQHLLEFGFFFSARLDLFFLKGRIQSMSKRIQINRQAGSGLSRI